MIVAISTHPESHHVERFGHDFPVLLVDLEGQEVRGTRLLEAQGGCCGHLARSLKGADVLICTGLGQGAARHLNEVGVKVAVVAEGVEASAALTLWATQSLAVGNGEPSGCSGQHEGEGHGCHHGHSEPQQHGAEGHGCGCGGHGKANN